MTRTAALLLATSAVAKADSVQVAVAANFTAPAKEIAAAFEQDTHHHAALSSLGLDIVAVFTSTPEAVQRFVARKPRPFSVVADPTSHAHETYGIERSLWRKLKGILTRVPTLIKGLRIVGLAGLNTTNLMPADFLIDEEGNIAEAYYGGDAGDRIPLDRVELFLARGLLARAGVKPAAVPS